MNGFNTEREVPKNKFFKKDDFLILFLTPKFSNFINIFSPHPNPLPASGERG
jgi:hypothetical protein